MPPFDGWGSCPVGAMVEVLICFLPDGVDVKITAQTSESQPLALHNAVQNP
jgi:hypothetical protein